MEIYSGSFNEEHSLHELKHYLPAQASLKDFVHHNTLHAFQKQSFFEALNNASTIFGYRVTLSLNEYRELFAKGQIREDVLTRVIGQERGIDQVNLWKEKLINQNYTGNITSRIGHLRSNWKEVYKVNLDKSVHPFLFRILGSFLDQGIAISPIPISGKSFLQTLRELEQSSLTSIFKTRRAREFLLNHEPVLADVLAILVGDESLFEHYLFDQQFSHPGWSGMVGAIETDPSTLLDTKAITLKELIYFELLLELDALDSNLGEIWKPLAEAVSTKPAPIFETVEQSELFEVLTLWQIAFEWTYYDAVLSGIQATKHIEKKGVPSFQGLFCIDDREYSLRRYIEQIDPKSATYGTPGFFGVEFFFQPENGKFFTKACPAPVTPKYLIKEVARKKGKKKDMHYSEHVHKPLRGWLISQTLGFWSAFKLFLNLFMPRVSPATAYSFMHMDKHSKLSIEHSDKHGHVGDLQVGFTIAEMATRVGNTLKSIGLITDFAPLVYVVGHGASSTNNTHYAGYDCGACCGRPGAVNARVFSDMANKPEVRELLAAQGLVIPKDTVFVGAMHDTTRDEIEFYDEHQLPAAREKLHLQNAIVFDEALRMNAKERSRRFDTINTKAPMKKLHERVKRRSVSLFEPRPELNHATNALCVIGRSSLTTNVFLDRRAFMNSYDYRVDPEGNFLLNILNAAAPVCGGINLEYYFSRVDNRKLGAGTKLPHNVIGLFAVANGVDGDLRPGLPSQMIEVHDPIRILFIVEHDEQVVLKTIKRNPATYEWFANEWVHLVVANPIDGKLYQFKEGQFVPYLPLLTQFTAVGDVMPIIERTLDNIPVTLVNA